MVNSFAHYVSSNQADILKDIFFSFFGLILGWIFSSKNDSVSNGTTVSQSIHFVNQNILHINNNQSYSYNRRKTIKRNSNSDSNGEIGVWFAGLVVVSFLFVKFHAYLLTYTSGFVFMALTCTVTIAIRLYKNNNFGNINKLWTCLCFAIVAVDVMTLVFLYKQDVSQISILSIGDFISSLGIEGVLKYSYFAAGFIVIQLPNVTLLILLIHMLAMNSYLARSGPVSAFIIDKTKNFTVKPIYTSVAIALICLMSILFSSGFLFDLISNGNQLTIDSNK